jgi:hypothetical protein
LSSKDDVILSFTDYNRLLTQIYSLEEQVKFLRICNSKLANELGASCKTIKCKCRRRRK